MRGKILLAGLILSLSGLSMQAQNATPSFPNDVYCSGVVKTASVPTQTFVITGEESNARLTYTLGDTVYINKGSDEGAKVGDEFSLIRAEKDPSPIEWTKWQDAIFRKMGMLWVDLGRAKVVQVLPKSSVAVIDHMCDTVQRGDIAIPFAEEPTPTLRPMAEFQRFAPPDGKSLAMVIIGKGFRNELGNNDIMYVNLGNAQGVHVGQYFRIFRYTGTQHEVAYQTPRYAFDQQFGRSPGYGFGSVPSKYDWTTTPREVLGEGIVLRTGENSSSVLITFAVHEIYSGDYVELE
ncbi:MAG TPA: hypothetical protein VJS43_13590 [Candidatus Acidoferrales bacterium]|nr:hypothetical protein [Candidatus Acidoferrales bacterium]